LSISVSKKWRESIFYEAANLLDKEDRRKVGWVILLQISFGFLDLLGVMLIGVIGALTITGVSSGQPGNRVSALLEFVGLEDSTLQFQDCQHWLSRCCSTDKQNPILHLFFTKSIIFPQ
jgi:hypothetical protein